MTGGNIIKPATLKIGENSSNTSETNNSIDLSQLKNLISDIVREQTQTFNRSSNSDTKIERDQTIDPRYLTDLNDLDKIPDVVKSLREFSGQPGEFGSWRKSVERILKIYEGYKGTPKYYGIISVIRNKITGNADTALESYNTPLCWTRISRCLTLHYADKRDMGTLEYQMTTLIQRNNSIPEFYQQVYHHLSLILNKLSSMEDMSQESMDVMTQSYRDKALDTFVRGLKGDLPRLLSMRGPSDLPEALHLCLKLENVQYRVQHSHGNINFRNPQFTSLPQLPPRRYIPPPSPPHNSQMRNFYPELLHRPQAQQSFPKPFQNVYRYSPNYYSKPFQPRYPQQAPRFSNGNYPSKPPESMDVDRSINSMRVNYQNRPPLNNAANKRPISNQMHQPAKFQRTYHTEQSYDDPSLHYYHEQIAAEDQQYDQTLVEYTSSQEILDLPEIDHPDDHPDEHEIIETVDDINFLD